jgi:hypothetical protein
VSNRLALQRKPGTVRNPFSPNRVTSKGQQRRRGLLDPTSSRASRESWKRSLRIFPLVVGALPERPRDTECAACCLSLWRASLIAQ